MVDPGCITAFVDRRCEVNEGGGASWPIRLVTVGSLQFDIDNSQSNCPATTTKSKNHTTTSYTTSLDLTAAQSAFTEGLAIAAGVGSALLLASAATVWLLLKARLAPTLNRCVDIAGPAALMICTFESASGRAQRVRRSASFAPSARQQTHLSPDAAPLLRAIAS